MSTKRNIANTEREVVITARLTHDQREYVRKCAAREQRTISAQIRYLIESARTADLDRPLKDAA